MEIIRDEVLKYIPFSPERLVDWHLQSDIVDFLCSINDRPGVILTSDGTRESLNYRDYGHDIFDEGKREFRDWAHRFLKNALAAAPSPGAFVDRVVVPDFYEDPTFGETAKYILAWDGVVNVSLSSGAFFSIAHILESVVDIKCSVSLAAQLYYKHSLQILRGVLEDLVLPIHFSENPQEYSDWKNNNYRTPSLRGKNGILRRLVDAGVLDNDLAGRVSQLYDNLNGFTHGSERRLINKGHYTRSWMGQVFVKEDYEEWCRCIKEAISIAIQLLRINLNQWESFRSRSKVVCPICHNESFDSERFVFGGEQFTKYKCLVCHDEVTHNSEGRQAYAQSFNGQIVSFQY